MSQKGRVKKDIKGKVLVADDARMVVKFHANVLRDAGYECEVAVNGVEAFEQMQKENFDIVITDLNMPKMSGLDLCRAIRKLPQYTSVPIVIVTTEEQQHDFQAGYDAGATLFMVKPVQPEALVDQVEMLLHQGKP